VLCRSLLQHDGQPRGSPRRYGGACPSGNDSNRGGVAATPVGVANWSSFLRWWQQMPGLLNRSAPRLSCSGCRWSSAPSCWVQGFCGVSPGAGCAVGFRQQSAPAGMRMVRLETCHRCALLAAPTPLRLPRRGWCQPHGLPIGGMTSKAALNCVMSFDEHLGKWCGTVGVLRESGREPACAEWEDPVLQV
jgi:hypothetical protein